VSGAEEVLRRATADDIVTLARLHHETVSVAYRDWFPPPAPSFDELVPQWAREVAAGHAVFVYGDGVGSVVARADGSLGRLHVHPSRWGEGIGQVLHDAAVGELRSSGHRLANLLVIEANVRARSLYERNGWVLDASVPAIEHLGVREVRYVLELASR